MLVFNDAKSIAPSEIVSIKQIQNKIVKSKAFLANASWDIESHNVLDTEQSLLLNNQLQNNDWKINESL